MNWVNKALRLAYRSWYLNEEESRPGYTILLPVPHDLPIFLQIALLNIAAQDREHLIEILVVPDQPSRLVQKRYEDTAKNLSWLPLRLVEMGLTDRLIGRLTESPGGNHFRQLINGIEASRSAHILFHDCDLFLAPGNFLRSRYCDCLDGRLSAFGVDLPPHRNNNLITDHMVATWELMVTREWLLKFQPWEHKSQYRRVNGKKLRFDTTLWPQFRTAPHEFARRRMEGFVHFGNVVSTYRKFLRARKPYEDCRFRILLIRLLMDAMDPETGQSTGVPSFEECAAGLMRKGLLSYVSERTAVNYGAFRLDVERLFALGILPQEGVSRMREGLDRFDKAFCFDLSEAQGADGVKMVS